MIMMMFLAHVEKCREDLCLPVHIDQDLGQDQGLGHQLQIDLTQEHLVPHLHVIVLKNENHLDLKLQVATMKTYARHQKVRQVYL